MGIGVAGVNVASLSLCYPSELTPHAGRFIHERLKALSELCKVRVISPVPSPFGLRPRKETWVEGPPPVWYVPMPYVPRVTRSINPWLYARVVTPMLRRWRDAGRLDVIDAHFCWPDGVAAGLVALRLGVPYVVTLRGVLHRYARSPFSRRAVVQSLENAAAVIAVSEALRRSAIELGVPVDKITVIRNGVDTSVFCPGDRSEARRALGRTEEERILITVGHLCRRKGAHRVLRILPELIKRDPRIRYVIVGADAAEGRFEKHLRRMCRELRLGDDVTFTGSMPPVDVAQWLRAADVFVLPTTNEGCCNALCEAVAAGLPVVTTDVGGNREILAKDGGFLVPVNRADALYDALFNALELKRACTQVSKRATWSDAAHDVYSVLDRAADASNANTDSLAFA